jgi:hypothetical protein
VRCRDVLGARPRVLAFRVTADVSWRVFGR